MHLERIATNTAPVPLAQRITPSPYTIPLPLSQRLHFRKTKIVLREKEFQPLIDATDERLQVIRDKGDTLLVKETLADDVEMFLSNFKKFKDSFHQNSDKYTNKNWRYIKRDLKAVKDIPFRDINNRWDQVCEELAALGKQKRFVYDN